MNMQKQLSINVTSFYRYFSKKLVSSLNFEI